MIAHRRMLTACFAGGGAVVLACLGHWAGAGVAAVTALRPVAWWVRGELMATRALLREEMRRQAGPGSGA